MTVKDLRTLVDNLDEYIHVPGGIERLKKTILHLAVSGKLVPQDLSEGTGQQLYDQIQTEKHKLIAEGKIKKLKIPPEVTGDETPFEIPGSWKWARLVDVLSVITDGDHQAPPKAEDGIPFLVIGDIRNGTLRPDAASRRVPLAYFNKLDWAHTPLSGDLLYTTVGSFGIPVPVEIKDSFCFQRHIGLLRPAMFQMQDYLYRFLESSYAFDQATNCATGIAQKTVPISGIREFLLPLPPIKEQSRIVNKIKKIFSQIDELSVKYKAEQVDRVRLVKSSLAKLSSGESTLALDIFLNTIKTKADAAELRKTILHLAVSGQLVPQDPSEGTGQALYNQIQSEKQNLVAEGKFKKQKLLLPFSEDDVPFEIPKSWKWAKLGDITNFGRAEKMKPAEVDDEQWILELEDIEKVSSKLIKRITTKIRKPSSDKNYFHAGDVLYGKLRPYLDKVIVAEETGISSSEILPISVFGRQFDPRYLWCYLKSPSFISTINSKAYGVKMPRLGTEDGRNMPIPIPPLHEQARIVKKCSELLKLTEKLENHLGGQHAH